MPRRSSATLTRFRRLCLFTREFRPFMAGRNKLMPTYEYHCSKCDQTFDLFQSMKDAALKTCPQQQCLQPKWGRGRVKRVLGTGAGLIFKGSGFYITDYRSENYKQAAKKDSAPAASSGGESKSGSESKSAAPAAKPASTPAKPKAAST
jgi:putative FmdB family regulatory protein